MSTDILDTIQDWRRQERSFCVATVLRTADATSAKAGAKALVDANGDMIGHLGGACVRRAVLDAAKCTLSSTEPSLIRVKPQSGDDREADDTGVRHYTSGCPSGGTVDILIEPYRPSPRLLVVGETPIAHQIRSQSAALGLRLVQGEAEHDLNALEPRDFIVIASQGQGDLQSLSAALATDAEHISFVASRKKAATLLSKLEDNGLTHNAKNRVKAPAGLDIGAIDPAEIALSVLAEITLWRRRSG